MAETLMTEAGDPVELDEAGRAFAAAMAAPEPDELEHAAPPRLDAPPPPDPETAPHGWTRAEDGSGWRPKKAAGRPRRGQREAEKPRTVPGGAAAAPKPDKPSQAAGSGPKDYTQGLTELCQGLWIACAATPVPWEDVRIRVRAQAYVLKTNAAGLVNGLNIMAQNSATVRWGVEKLTTGGAAWILPAMFALAPFAVQTSGIWRAPVEGDMRRLAEQTEADWAAEFEAMKTEFAAEQEPQAA